MRLVSHLAKGAIVALVLGLVLALLVAPLAVAESPKRLASPVTDDAGVLPSGAAAEIQSAFDQVQSSTGVQTWVWYVNTTNGVDAPAFATSTAQASGLGGADVLLVIAMQYRAYGYWKGSSVGVSDSQLDLILSRTLPTNLRANAPDKAAIDFADQLGAALAPAPTPVPTSVPNPAATSVPVVNPTPAPASGGDATVGTLLAILLVLVGAGFIIWYLATHRDATGNVPAGASGPRDDLGRLSTKDLEAQANSSLLQTDDAVRDSEQELGFAQAQFGDAAAAPFAEALAGAKADLKTAFTMRQQLDDATPDTPAQRHQMLVALIQACRSAQQRLDAQKERFEQLRALQQRAPGIIEGLPAQADALAARVAAAGPTMAHIQTYADPDWQAVAPNLDEAGKRVAAVRAAVDAGRAAVTAGEAPKAAAAAQAGQDALAQGGRFIDAIEALAKQLDAAAAALAAQLTAAEQDVARAKAAVSGADPAAAAGVAEADRLLGEARTALNPPKPHVMSALDKARQAEKAAEDVLARVRSAQEAAARAAAQLDASIRTAQAAVGRAGGLVATRKGAVGGEARTRLAEAQRHLDQALALAPTDPGGATREADAASRLASQAESLAQRDYDNWNDPWRGGGGGGGHDAGADLAGAIIGGIIGGMLSGGGRHGRGGPFGGGPFGDGGGGGPFGGGGFGGFGGGWGGGGGFGGSSGGGSFGGGGGSSGGGRW